MKNLEFLGKTVQHIGMLNKYCVRQKEIRCSYNVSMWECGKVPVIYTISLPGITNKIGKIGNNSHLIF